MSDFDDDEDNDPDYIMSESGHESVASKVSDEHCESDNDPCNITPTDTSNYIGKDGTEWLYFPYPAGRTRMVVEALTEKYYHTNRNVTCDNYFVDMELASSLLAKGVTLVGTVKQTSVLYGHNFCLTKIEKNVLQYLALQETAL